MTLSFIDIAKTRPTAVLVAGTLGRRIALMLATGGGVFGFLIKMLRLRKKR